MFSKKLYGIRFYHSLFEVNCFNGYYWLYEYLDVCNVLHIYVLCINMKYLGINRMYSLYDRQSYYHQMQNYNYT